MTCSDHKRPVARPRGLWATVMWLCKWGREFNIFLYCWVHGFDVCSLIEKPTAPYLRPTTRLSLQGLQITFSF